MVPTLVQQEREGVAEHFSEQAMARMPQVSYPDTLDEATVHELTEDRIDPVPQAAEAGTASGPGVLLTGVFAHMFGHQNADEVGCLGGPPPVKDFWACPVGTSRPGIRMDPAQWAAIAGSMCSEIGNRHGIRVLRVPNKPFDCTMFCANTPVKGRAVDHAVGPECTTVQGSHPPCPNTKCCNICQMPYANPGDADTRQER